MYIAREVEPEDGIHGSMSLCAHCCVKMLEQLGTNYATLEELR